MLSYEMGSLDVQVYQRFENLHAKVSQYAGSGRGQQISASPEETKLPI